MKVIRFLRFILLGIGIAFIPIGIGFLFIRTNVNPVADVFFQIMIVAMGTAFIVSGIGCLIASLIMFIKYHKYIKSQQ